MIGAYAIDASMVYSMNKHHELYRAWVPLMDDEDPDDVGVQGYLKISIQVRGVASCVAFVFVCYSNGWDGKWR